MGLKWIRKGLEEKRMEWELFKAKNGWFENAFVCLRTELEFEEKGWKLRWIRKDLEEKRLELDLLKTNGWFENYHYCYIFFLLRTELEVEQKECDRN